MIALLSAEELAQYPVAILPPQMGTGEAGKDAACASCEGFRPAPQRRDNLQVDPEMHPPSIGVDAEIAYFYNAATNGGPFGYARQLSVSPTAQASGSPAIVTLTRGSGNLVSYLDDGTGAFTAQTPGLLASLVKDVGNSLWKETTPDGLVSAYPLDTAGHTTTIAWREDAVGNRQTFSYASGLLSTIEDAAGRFVSFSYASGLLASIQDWAGRLTTFQYDTASASPKSLLTTVIGPSGCQTQ